MWLFRRARTYTYVLLSLSLVAFIVYSALIVSFPYPLDYGEAPLLDRAMRWTGGGTAYRNDLSSPPYIITNYPPLYVLFLVPIVKLAGPTFGLVAGRLLSVACALLTALVLGLIVHANTKDYAAAWGTALTFIAMPYVVSWAPFLRVDMLALLLSVAGLYVVTRWHHEAWGLALAAFLFTASVYTRQSYGLAGPLAGFIWVWHKRGSRWALTLAVIVMLLGLSAFSLANRLTNGGFTYNVVTANMNSFEWHTVGRGATYIVRKLPVLLLVALAWFAVPREHLPMAPLVLPYLLGSILVAGTIGKVGSNVNYLLELCAALSLASSIAYSKDSPIVVLINRTPHHTGALRSVARGALSLALAVQAAMLLGADLRYSVTHLAWRATTIGELDALDVLVAAEPDLVIADQFMGLLTLQGRPLHLQPFEMTQLAVAGNWDQKPLLDEIQAGRFSMIIIHESPFKPTRWTPEMLAAIDQHYVKAEYLADSTIYRPRSRYSLDVETE